MWLLIAGAYCALCLCFLWGIARRLKLDGYWCGLWHILLFGWCSFAFVLLFLAVVCYWLVFVCWLCCSLCCDCLLLLVVDLGRCRRLLVFIIGGSLFAFAVSLRCCLVFGC